ncbi:unnamed protein product [Rhizoctonia solani]|uniref:Zn(2)-C6 fungal-type domain-containing protein n=1 Tax=Rhizoctonia solani TaxID=456999 RepID=A0A8H3DXQ6_9AGAM|nr:unnamed protein product [Rhizoctonia solani]
MAPAARRTRSGRTAPSAPTKRIRTKGGCLTCRIRRKKCDESRDFANGGCETCSRLHIECLGYSTKRPEWLKGARVDDFKRKIKHFLADHSARSSARSPDEAFLELHHLRNSSTPPRQRSESNHTDSDSDSDSDAASTVDSKPQQFSPVCSIPTLPAIIPDYWMVESPLEAPWVQPLDFLPMGFQDESSPTTMYPHYNTFPQLDYSTLSVDSPMHNEHFDPPMAFDCGPLDSGMQVGVSPYAHPNPNPSVDETLVWENTLASLFSLAQAGDPEGVAAVSEVLDNGLEQMLGYDSAETNSRQLAARRYAQQCLLKSGYNDQLARAVTALWMIQVTLRQGHFDSWGNCLDIVIEWMRVRLASPLADISNLDLNDKRVLGHGLWMDLVATATIQRVPLHIDIYRRVLRSPDSIVSDCPNKAALTFVEAIALAANPSHLSQARVKLQQLRQNLATPPEDDDPETMSTARVHTTGIKLYLETVANRGMIDSPVQEAVESICEAVCKQPQRSFAFWVFIAGCHTKDTGRWNQCSSVMNKLIQAGGDDGALKAAFGVMNETYNARKHGSVAPDFWVQKMREQQILLA